MTQISLVPDFYNVVNRELDKKYFPDVKYYRDKKECAESHYSMELFNNGCITYSLLISRLAKHCNDTKENIHNLVKRFVTDFKGFEYNVK